MDGDGMLVLSLLTTERWLDDRGWDQPPIVLALLPEAPVGLEVPGRPRDSGTVALWSLADAIRGARRTTTSPTPGATLAGWPHLRPRARH